MCVSKIRGAELESEEGAKKKVGVRARRSLILMLLHPLTTSFFPTTSHTRPLIISTKGRRKKRSEREGCKSQDGTFVSFYMFHPPSIFPSSLSSPCSYYSHAPPILLLVFHMHTYTHSLTHPLLHLLAPLPCLAQQETLVPPPPYLPAWLFFACWRRVSVSHAGQS